jgi:hypothetical protein
MPWGAAQAHPRGTSPWSTLGLGIALWGLHAVGPDAAADPGNSRNVAESGEHVVPSIHARSRISAAYQGQLSSCSTTAR